MASPTDPPPFGSVPQTVPPAPTGRTGTVLGPGGPVRTFLRRWGFPLFILFIVVIGRRALMPFIFAT